MGGQQPKSIFTDKVQAMANAIKVVFPESRHRLCLWHINKDARQHLAGLYSSQHFCARFNKCLNGCMTVMEFELTWREMIEKHNLQNHAWLNRLYQIREKWCLAFSVDFFSAKMKSTQWSESTNSVFHQIMKTSMPLIQVIQFYEKKATQMRQDEIDDDYHCKNGAPSKATMFGGILSHGAKVSTLVLFRMFEKEFNFSFGLSYVETNHQRNSFYIFID